LSPGEKDTYLNPTVLSNKSIDFENQRGFNEEDASFKAMADIED